MEITNEKIVNRYDEKNLLSQFLSAHKRMLGFLP